MKPLLLDVTPLLRNSLYVKEIKTKDLNDQFHFHDTYEIALILKGSGRRIVGDCVDNFWDGDLIMIGPRIPHVNYSDKKYGGKEATASVYSIVVYFQPDWITAQHLNSIDFGPIRLLFNRLKRGIRINEGKTHAAVVKLILKLMKTKGVESFITLFQILHEVSGSDEYSFLASPKYNGVVDKHSIKRLHEIYEYLMSNFTEEILLDHVASMVNMTSTSLCRFFKNKTGKTITSFVNEIRVGYARELLINEDMDISQVCFQSGFNNFTNFNKNFKKFTNKTPSEFRSELTLSHQNV